MAQFTAPGFQVGDRAFLGDGRNGLITASRFIEEDGVWEHLLDGIFEFFAEFDLFHDDPTDAAPVAAPVPAITLPPSEEQEELVGFVTLADLRALVLDIVGTGVGVGVSQSDLEDAVNAGVERSNLIAQANLTLHVAEVERKAADVELFTAAQFSELESLVTTTLSEIEKRSLDLEAAAEESSGGGFFGFVSGLGGLVSNPVEWIMSRLGDHFVSEVNDGLNR